MAASTPPDTAREAAPLEVTGLWKRFGGVAAVAGISLAVRRGECLGLLGPNGAGKSTLLRCAAGRLRPDAGAVTVGGAPAGSADARRTLGWIPQELAVYPRLSARENLETFGRYHGLRGAALRAATARCLEWAALTERAGDPAGRLSGGMKRRLNMAAGLIHGPRVVIMDEPTVGVDPQSRNRIFEMIGALRAEGVSVVYTTHHMEEAERLCDRIAVVDHGRVIALGTRDELVRRTFGAGHEPVDAAPRRPDLEAVFLHLTGRELRE